MSKKAWSVGQEYIGGIPLYVGDRNFFTIHRPLTEESYEQAHLIAAAPAMHDALQRASDLLFEIERLKDASLVENNPEIVEAIETALRAARKTSTAPRPSKNKVTK